MTLPNWKNQTIWTGDNLSILRGMNSQSVDLIYLDPPFNSNANYAAPVGSQAAGAAFKDTWGLDDVDLVWHVELKYDYPALYALISAARETHSASMMSYLIYMAVRLIEMKRVLKETGSIYLHCDPTASHYLKLMMDAVFGRENFRNEVIWCYSSPSNSKQQFPRKHDTILWYSVSDTWTFNADAVRVPYVKMETGKTSGIFKKSARLSDKGKLPESWWSKFSPVGRLKKERVGYPTQKPLAVIAADNQGEFESWGCGT